MDVGTATEQLERVATEGERPGDYTARADSVLRRAIGYEVSAWASVDPASLLFTSCDLYPGATPSAESALFEIEFADCDPGSYRDLHRQGTVAAALRQYADPASVERYRSVIAPAGGFDELRIMLRLGTHTWGTVTAYRVARPFGPDEVDTAARLAPVLARGVRRTFLEAALGDSRLARPPGQLVLDADGETILTTSPAEEWLDTLTPSQLGGVMASLRTAVRTGESAQLTLAGRQGLLTFHATPAKGPEGYVGVIVEQPRPAELTPVIVSGYGLTPREAETLALVLRGHTSRQIARRLGISEHTVSDHLKSLFGKVGVGSRSELVAATYTRFYLPRTEAGLVPSPYGWFLEDPPRP